MGSALESSSFKEGGFNSCCIKYEVLIGSGDIVESSPSINSDLFYGLSGSMGTLGLLLLIEVELIEAKPWVKINLKWVNDLNAMFFALKNTIYSNTHPTYLDSIIYSKKCSVIIEGYLKNDDEIDSEVKRIHLNQFTNFFYKTIENLSFQNKTYKIRTLDYLFRFDRGAFWMGHYLTSFKWLFNYLFFFKKFESTKLTFKSSPLLEKLIVRLCGNSLSSQNLYKKLQTISQNWFKSHFIVQDFYIPIEKGVEFLEFSDKTTGIYPIWVCPIKTSSFNEIFAPHFIKNKALCIDIGIYGKSNKDIDSIKLTSLLEEKVVEIGGKKMFYAHTYLSLKQLHKIYDFNYYNHLRDKYDATKAFLSIEEKLI
jgi:hypothetical protein